MALGPCFAESPLLDVSRRGLKAPLMKGPEECLISPPRTNSAETTDAGIPRSSSMPLWDRRLAKLQEERMYLLGGVARILI